MDKAAAPLIMASVIYGDFRSRLRYRPSGGSERFHALAAAEDPPTRSTHFACDRHNLVPGSQPVPAHTIAKEMRCARAACAKLFAAADSANSADVDK